MSRRTNLSWSDSTTPRKHSLCSSAHLVPAPQHLLRDVAKRKRVDTGRLMPPYFNPAPIRYLVFMSCYHMSPSAQTYDSASVNLSVFAPSEVPDYMQALVSWLFGCHHHHVSRVFTIERRTYQVCFDCGAEFAYSWDRMHRTHLSKLHTAGTEALMDAMYLDVRTAAKVSCVGLPSQMEQPTTSTTRPQRNFLECFPRALCVSCFYR